MEKVYNVVIVGRTYLYSINIMGMTNLIVQDKKKMLFRYDTRE